MSEGVNLSPEAILQAATETEAQVWVQAGATNEREESFQFNQSDVGFNILQHGNSRKQIHEYFMRFEQRKCCLLLAACKQRFANVRLVRNDGRDSGIEEGAMGKADLAQNESVIGLDAVEFQVFKNALKCAAFPVLGAPEPPSGVTPIPAPSHTHIGGLKGIMAKRKETSLSLQHVTSLSPLSMHDSGVEDQEQEDSALVPTETLCELLRRAFRLTQEKFNHYEKIVIAHIDKKSPQKVLAEELVQQLIALENNQNPFYSPKTFLNRIGYDQWQKKERQHISDLLSKFWHFGLPTPADKTAKMQSLHGQYCKLMEKLISYESPYRQVSELIAPPPTSPLSIASVRLLKEFGLRYGVGDQYCKIVYLHYLALNFDPTVWFIHHISQSLTVVMETMPRDRSCLVIIQEEFTMLKESLNLLEVKSSTAIAKMKTLFSNIGSRPLDGVEPLVELLSLTLQAKSYLLSSPAANLGPVLFKIAYSIFPTTYERHKMVSQDELRHNKWNTDLSPKLLNMLIGHIRDEVQDYKNNYQQAFEKYFDITVEAAQEFYHLLIADVVELVKHTTKTQTGGLEINRLMLSLAYRLNQLDQDWRHYIPPR
ncbi:uncharacterized protein LOC128210431 [Mya arenaria]|uniref:uncharacterized protein LOC128210431 n=1 Tax=Mya arenaria TaxID=6604 RepID=UPI0022DEC1F9|nr:uncharacterized protein LOC128210431 [Mya arenaria]